MVAAPGRRRLRLSELAGRAGWLGGVATRRRDHHRRAGARTASSARRSAHLAATLAAPTLLEHATEAQQVELVRPIATGEAAWCQLFSEPGSGSDLASVGTRAERDGDEWVVTGQKVWNSAADTADFGMLLARTDVDVPKHAGHHLLRHRHEAARDRGAAAQADERRVQLLRGLPRPRPGSRPTA